MASVLIHLYSCIFCPLFALAELTADMIGQHVDQNIFGRWKHRSGKWKCEAVTTRDVINVNWCRPRLPRGPLSFPAQTAKTAKVTGNTASFAVCITKWCRRWAAECSNDDDYLVICERGRCVGLNFQFGCLSLVYTSQLIQLFYTITPSCEDPQSGNTIWARAWEHLYSQKVRFLVDIKHRANKLCGRPPQYAPAPCKLTFDLWPWKWCPSHV